MVSPAGGIRGWCWCGAARFDREPLAGYNGASFDARMRDHLEDMG